MRLSEAMTQFPRPGWENGGLGAAGRPSGAAARRGEGNEGRRAAAVLPRGRGACAEGGCGRSVSFGPVREKRAARGERAAHCGRWRLFRRCSARAGWGRGGLRTTTPGVHHGALSPAPSELLRRPGAERRPRAGPGRGAGGGAGHWEGLVCVWDGAPRRALRGAPGAVQPPGREGGGGVGSHGPGALSAAGLCERGLRPCAVRGGRAAGKGNGRQAL